MTTIHPRLGVSSWSLHQSLTRGDFTLLDLPRIAAEHGFAKIEICHFHLPSTDQAYLAELRAAFHASETEFFTLLIDKGDMTHPDPVQRDQEVAGILGWIDIAAAVGARRVRVIAGDAEPSAAAVGIAVDNLEKLAAHGALQGVRVVTENSHRLMDHPAEVVAVMERTQGRVGLKLDFGNWPSPRKYDDLPKIAAYAECTHAKASFTEDGQIDGDDFRRCLDICNGAGFEGVHCLVYDKWRRRMGGINANG